jgi:hypothetical protein
MVRRASTSEQFGPEQHIDELSSPNYDEDLRLSPDRHHAYFSTNGVGGGDLYESSR